MVINDGRMEDYPPRNVFLSDFSDEYQRLKEELLQTDPTGKDSYVGDKSKFVNKVLTLAKKEPSFLFDKHNEF